jgi:hypothetical protein
MVLDMKSFGWQFKVKSYKKFNHTHKKERNYYNMYLHGQSCDHHYSVFFFNILHVFVILYKHNIYIYNDYSLDEVVDSDER